LHDPFGDTIEKFNGLSLDEIDGGGDDEIDGGNDEIDGNELLSVQRFSLSESVEENTLPDIIVKPSDLRSSYPPFTNRHSRLHKLVEERTRFKPSRERLGLRQRDKLNGTSKRFHNLLGLNATANGSTAGPSAAGGGTFGFSTNGERRNGEEMTNGRHLSELQNKIKDFFNKDVSEVAKVPTDEFLRSFGIEPRPNATKKVPEKYSLIADIPGEIDSTDGLFRVPDEMQDEWSRKEMENKIKIGSLQSELYEMRVAFVQKLYTIQSSKYKYNNLADKQIASSEDDKASSSSNDATWERVEEKEIRQGLWMPDEAASNCFKCQTKFWLGRRKHHCRKCGNIFCADCCNDQERPFSSLPINIKKYYRLCTDCVASCSRNNSPNTSTCKQAAAEEDQSNMMFPPPASSPI